MKMNNLPDAKLPRHIESIAIDQAGPEVIVVMLFSNSQLELMNQPSFRQNSPLRQQINPNGYLYADICNEKQELEKTVAYTEICTVENWKEYFHWKDVFEVWKGPRKFVLRYGMINPERDRLIFTTARIFKE